MSLLEPSPTETFNDSDYAGNMSRVDLAANDLNLVCSNNTTGECNLRARGISLSTPIMMMTFGVLGNILALLVLYSSRKEAQARRTVFFVMLAGLAWTDLIGQLAVGPIAIITYANGLTWQGGVPVCRYHGFMMVSFGLVTPLIVCCMSFERFLAIRFSYFYARHVTRRKAQLTFLACWGVTVLFTALPFVGFGSYELQYPASWCFLNFHRESLLDAVYAAFFAIFNIIAIIIMIVCNFIVSATLFRMRRSRQLNSSPSIDRKLSVSGIAGSSTTGTVIRARRHSDMEAQMIWFLGLITIAFSVCWLPLNVHILVMQFTGETNRLLDLTVIRMASSNQILDPWLYVIFRKNSLLRIFRRLKACFQKKKEPLRNGNAKTPSVRYVMGNRSFTFEATTVGKTVLVNNKRCGPSPRHDSDGQGEGGYLGLNDDSATSTDSVAKLVSVCSNCNDNGPSRRKVLNPLLSLRLGQSPSDARKDFCKSDVDRPDDNIGSKSRDQDVSESLIGQLKPEVKTNGHCVSDQSDSKEVFQDLYDSLGSAHHCPYIVCRSNKCIKADTPTSEIDHDSSVTEHLHNQGSNPPRHPPKYLHVTSSNYVVFNTSVAGGADTVPASSTKPAISDAVHTTGYNTKPAISDAVHTTGYNTKPAITDAVHTTGYNTKPAISDASHTTPLNGSTQITTCHSHNHESPAGQLVPNSPNDLHKGQENILKSKPTHKSLDSLFKLTTSEHPETKCQANVASQNGRIHKDSNKQRDEIDRGYSEPKDFTHFQDSYVLCSNNCKIDSNLPKRNNQHGKRLDSKSYFHQGQHSISDMYGCLEAADHPGSE